MSGRMDPLLTPKALNAIRVVYDRLPRDRRGKVARTGHIRALLAEFGITRQQLYRIVRNGK